MRRVTAPAQTTLVSVVTTVCDRILTRMYWVLLFALVGAAQARPALVFSEPLLGAAGAGVEYAPTARAHVRPHPAVALSAASEALLPRELQKSADFYENPAVAAGLAKESWFADKEMQVVEREAEKIPREKIYKIVKNAGFLDQN